MALIPENKSTRACLFVSILISLLMIVILVPLSFSYVEYYEYGLSQRKTTGSVDTDRVYPQGRYAIGPDHKFITYQADAHYEALDELSIFSAGGSNSSIGLEFVIDIDFTFFLIEEEIGVLHEELAKNYRNIIVSRAKDAIKNEAIFVTFTEYFRNRKEVEARFTDAVQARWNTAPSLHCMLDQFHLGRIRIPESVATKQLETTVQNERNDQEEFLQQAQLEREQTAVQVNIIKLDKNKTLRTAQAEASLLRSKAVAESERILAQAGINGTRLLVDAVGISTQEHVSAFTYIRTLRNRKDLEIDVSYLNSNSVLRTQQV
jgi:hypothetical protein